MTPGRVGICTGLARSSLVVPLRDQLQHILHTVHLIMIMMTMMTMTMMKMTIGTDTKRITLERKMGLAPFLRSRDIIVEWGLR